MWSWRFWSIIIELCWRCVGIDVFWGESYGIGGFFYYDGCFNIIREWENDYN